MSRKVIIGFFLVVTVLPLLAGLVYALLYSLGLIGILSEGFTLSYWSKIFDNQEIVKSGVYSFLIATVSLLGAVVIPLITVWFFHNQLENKRLFNYLRYLPLCVPPIVMSFFIFRVFGGSGLLARVAFQVGLIESPAGFPELINDQYGIGIVIAHWLLAFPFFQLVILESYERNQLGNMLQVSYNLGSSAQQAFRRVYAPIILRQIFPTMVIFFLFFMAAYEVPLILGVQSPRMISVLVLDKLTKFNLADKPEAYALTVTYVLVVLIAVYFLFRKRNLKIGL